MDAGIVHNFMTPQNNKYRYKPKRVVYNSPAKLAQSAARLTLVQEVASSNPTAGRLTQPSQWRIQDFLLGGGTDL